MRSFGLMFVGVWCLVICCVVAQDYDNDSEDWKEANMKFLIRSLEMDEDEKEHLKEHLQDTNINLDDLSPEELQFYYFKTHDTNNDNVLDGLELLHALEHSRMDNVNRHGNNIDLGTDRGHQTWKNIAKNIITNIDKTLKDDDLDGNGYLDYTEFASSRRMFSLKRNK